MELTPEYLEKIFDETSPEDFEINLYMLWCESVTTNSREFQKVLFNAGIKKWFDYELSKQIDDYIFLVNQFPNATTADSFKLYMRCIYKIFSFSPKTLILEAKKREKTTAVQGIALTTSIIKQN